MKTLTLRGIDEEVSERLKQTASKKGLSLNAYVLSLLQESQGLSKTVFRPQYDDLDELAGTWDSEQSEHFNNSIKDFEVIDEDIWK